MQTFRFRDFPVYKDARVFRKTVKSVLKQLPQEEKFRLIDQIHRSGLSILLNIAEGSAKQSDKDFARYLEMSIASLNEVVAGCDAAYDDDYISEEQLTRIDVAAEHLAKQLGGFLKHLRS